MEELKKDVDAAKIPGIHSTNIAITHADNNIQDMSLMKKSDHLASALHLHKKAMPMQM